MSASRPVAPRFPASLRALLAVCLAAGATLAAACSGGDNLPDPFAPQSARSIQIEVENLHFNQATLHAVREGQRMRLGIVNGKSHGSWRLPWDRGQDLQIEIDILASGACITRPLQVEPGEIVELQIQSRMELSPDCFPTRGRGR